LLIFKLAGNNATNNYEEHTTTDIAPSTRAPTPPVTNTSSFNREIEGRGVLVDFMETEGNYVIFTCIGMYWHVLACIGMKSHEMT